MSANLVFRRAGLYQPSAFRQSRRQPSSGEERKAKSEKRYFDCAGKGKDTDVRTHAAVVPFPSTGGVDVSLHTLGPATSAGHRRRSHRYAIRPRRSETLNCHYMMRGRRGKQQQDRSGVRGCWCVEHPGSRHQKISPGFAMKWAPQRIMSCGLIEPQIPPLGVKPSVGMTG